jgi:hypothetical protein
MNEQSNKKLYKTIPLRVRILVRVIVFLIRRLQPTLEKSEMSAYFSIGSYADQVEDKLEVAESKGTLQ